MQPFHVHSLPYFADSTVFFSAVRNAPGAILFDSGRPTSLRDRYDLMSAGRYEAYNRTKMSLQKHLRSVCA